MPRTPLPMAAKFENLLFPILGLDFQRGFGKQRPFTTPVGVNVRTFECLTQRARGGRRPGMVRHIGQLPSGATAFQELDTIIVCDGTALSTPFDGYPPTLIADPSSPGPPSSWGTGILNPTPTGWPTGTTGVSVGHRTPGGAIPPGGTAKPPNKNLAGPTPIPPIYPAPPPSPGPTRCFTGLVTYLIAASMPDPYGWNGNSFVAFGGECRYYNPPTIPAPSDAESFASVQTHRDNFVATTTLHLNLISLTVTSNVVIMGAPGCTNVGGSC